MLKTDPDQPLLLALERPPFPPAGRRVLLAVSGGPDSTALLVASVEAGHDVVAAHFDHALREGSNVAAQQVTALCARLNVQLVTERRASPMPRGSIQAAARALRYEFLDRARLTAHADAVALAHTADDVVEGVVLHLLRGCGLAGMRGMPAERGPFVRPWLGVFRSQIVEFLGRRDIRAFEDPANADSMYARVRARRLLPQLERDRPGIVRRFHAAAMRASSIHEAALSGASAALEARAQTDAELRSLPQPEAFERLKLLYSRAGGAQPGLSRSQLDAMLRLTDGRRGGRGVDLPGGMRFRVVGHKAEVYASAAARRTPWPERRLEVRRCEGCGDHDAAHLRLGLDLHLGFRRPGLRMRPAGGAGTRKLQDILVDARVPREDRDTWPLVFAGERLVWVPGVAVDRDHASTPGDQCQHVNIIPMPVR